MGLAKAERFLLDLDDPDAAAERAALLAERPGDLDLVLAGQPEAVHDVLALGRGGPDDVCALRPADDGVHRLVGGVVCFPSHWRLADKLGRTLTEIHAPVPGYAVELAAKVDTFVARLRPGQVAARRNWLLHERPDRFAPVRPPREGRPFEDWWLRSERQALTRIAGSDVVAFSIRTQQVRLGDLPPDAAGLLARQLAAEPPELSGYRGYLDVRSGLVAALTTVADQP